MKAVANDRNRRDMEETGQIIGRDLEHLDADWRTIYN
jgi:hypothetical protein